MVPNRPQGDAATDVAAWGGRDRAAKVAAAASTIAHGWDRLPEGELRRLCDALDDHVRSYLDWLSGMPGEDATRLRTVLRAIRLANDALLEEATPEEDRARSVSSLLQSARDLIAGIDSAAGGSSTS